MELHVRGFDLFAVEPLSRLPACVCVVWVGRWAAERGCSRDTQYVIWRREGAEALSNGQQQQQHSLLDRVWQVAGLCPWYQILGGYWVGGPPTGR